MSQFVIRKAERKQAKIRVLLAGPSGSGKTYSALLMAKGLVGNWSDVVVIDTEKQSADLYSDIGNYNVLSLEPPFTPERYVAAIESCEKSGAKVIIVDSISHEWDGEGGCLAIHERMTGNSYTNWAEVGERHKQFLEKMLSAKTHVIATGRSKQDYVMTKDEGTGKTRVEKVGLKTVTRDGVEYEFTLTLDLDINNNARSSKDRTSMFHMKPVFVIDESTGIKIAEWCQSGATVKRETPKTVKLAPESDPNKPANVASALDFLNGSEPDESLESYKAVIKACKNEDQLKAAINQTVTALMDDRWFSDDERAGMAKALAGADLAKLEKALAKTCQQKAERFDNEKTNADVPDFLK